MAVLTASYGLFLVALVLLVWGLFGFGMVPSPQYRVVSLAGPGSALAQSLPASAANVGIAFGSFAGGVAIGTSSAARLQAGDPDHVTHLPFGRSCPVDGIWAVGETWPWCSWLYQNHGSAPDRIGGAGPR